MNKERIEYKYFVARPLQTALVNDIARFCGPDRHAGDSGGVYAVASIYYENLGVQSYHEKVEGLPDRRKLRVRFYPQPSCNPEFVTVEIKQRTLDRILKRRMRLPFDRFEQLLKDDHGVLMDATDPVTSEYNRMTKVNGVFPALRIDYLRSAYVGRGDNGVRITLDRDVKADRFDGSLRRAGRVPVYPFGTGVLEIKTAGYMPFWLQTVLQKYGLSREAISKYVGATRAIARRSTLGFR